MTQAPPQLNYSGAPSDDAFDSLSSESVLNGDSGLSLELDELLAQSSESTEKPIPVASSVAPIARSGMGIQLKATLLAIAVGVLPVAGLGFLAYQVADGTLREQIRSTEQVEVTALSETVSDYLDETYRSIVSLSQADIFANPNIRDQFTVQDKASFLNRVRANSGGLIGAIVVVNLDGEVVYQTDGPPVPNRRESEWFKGVASTGQPFIEQPRARSDQAAVYSFFVAAPIRDSQSNAVIAQVAAAAPIAKLEERIEEFGQTDQQEYAIVSHAGGRLEAFISEDKDRIGENFVQDLASLRNEIGSGPTSMMMNADSTETNKSQIAARAPVPPTQTGSFDPQWDALLLLDRSAAFAAQRQLGLTFLGGTVAAAGAIAAIAYLVSRRALQPILDAAQAVDRIGEGDLDTRLNVSGNDELAVLGSNINQMASRMQQLVSDQEFSVEQANLLSEITSARAFSEEQYEQVFDKALADVRALMRADRVVIYRFNQDFSGYISNESVASGWPRALGDQIEDACIPQVLLDAYRDGRVQPADDVFNSGYHPDHLDLMYRLQIKSNLVAPLINQGKLYGILVVHHCADKHQWQETEIAFARQLALQFGSLLERVTFLNQLDNDAERARLLRDFTTEATQLEDAEELLTQLPLDKVRQGIQSDRVIVYTFDEEWKGTVVAESIAPGWPVAIGAKIADPCFAENYVEKYQRGRVQATPDIYKADLTECHLQQLEPFAVRANLVVPILQTGKLLGLLIAHQCSGTRDWTQEEIDFFSQVSTQLGFALDRAALLESQKLSKEQLQKRALELLMEVDPIGRGDLTVRATVTEDEIGTIADSYNSTVSNLRQIVEQVQSAAQQVNLTTGTSETSVRELSEEALRQAEEVTVALERIEAMTQSIREVAASAEQAELAVKQATSTVNEGDRAMNRTVDGILTIRDTVSEASKKVKRLGDSMQRVSKVVKLIGSFAAQTNLLALNASMEAARAGEEGRGFAVVADQVRDLARQSADA
ncbi:MAG: GAF domain-containing protein, partial [Cyanobacteria bacterium J06639_1]